MNELSHLVILGAGFGGIGALKKLRDANVRITLIDKCEHHTFQPLLYQVATDDLAPRPRSYALSPFSPMLPNQATEIKP
jgi:NADH dehydrogenase FAD-containing subunit